MSELLSLKEDPRRRCKWTQNAGNVQMFLFCWLHLININECNRFSASNLNFLGPSHVDWMFPGDKENRHINGNIYTSAAHTDLVRDTTYIYFSTQNGMLTACCCNFQTLLFIILDVNQLEKVPQMLLFLILFLKVHFYWFHISSSAVLFKLGGKFSFLVAVSLRVEG